MTRIVRSYHAYVYTGPTIQCNDGGVQSIVHVEFLRNFELGFAGMVAACVAGFFCMALWPAVRTGACDIVSCQNLIDQEPHQTWMQWLERLLC